MEPLGYPIELTFLGCFEVPGPLAPVLFHAEIRGPKIQVPKIAYNHVIVRALRIDLGPLSIRVLSFSKSEF